MALQAEVSLLHEFQGRVTLRTEIEGRTARLRVVWAVKTTLAPVMLIVTIAVSP